jgi:hypothetical protein
LLSQNANVVFSKQIQKIKRCFFIFLRNLNNLAIWRFGDLAIWRFGDLAIWRFNDLTI